MASDDIPLKSELESFREQWRAEVRAKVPGPQQQTANVAGPSDTGNLLKTTKTQGKVSKPPKPVVGGGKKVVHHEEDEEYVQTRVFDELHPTPAEDESKGKGKGKEEETGDDEPVSALEHYEKAVEREVAGMLGDSLALYRKAFRVSPPLTPVIEFHVTDVSRWITAST
jgi:F-box protein 9